MADEKKPVKCDSLEAIERLMPQIQQMFEQSAPASLIGANVVAPLAEAIVTLAAEIRRLREAQEKHARHP